MFLEAIQSIEPHVARFDAVAIPQLGPVNAVAYAGREAIHDQVVARTAREPLAADPASVGLAPRNARRIARTSIPARRRMRCTRHESTTRFAKHTMKYRATRLKRTIKRGRLRSPGVPGSGTTIRIATKARAMQISVFMRGVLFGGRCI